MARELVKVGRAVVAVAVFVAIAITIAVTAGIAIPTAAVIIVPVARPRAPFAVVAIDYFEVGATAAIDPDAVAVISPGAVENAIGFTALAHDEDTIQRIYSAEIALHVIGGAIDQGGGASLPVAGNGEVRAAATIDPDASIVIAPGAILNALGFAFLVDHLYSAGGIDGANVTTHVVGRTRHPQGLRHGCGLSGPGSRCNREQECSRNQSKRCRNELVRASAKTLHGEPPFPSGRRNWEF